MFPVKLFAIVITQLAGRNAEAEAEVALSLVWCSAMWSWTSHLSRLEK